MTLAYHVIAAWFVRSRLAYRKAFVGFVSKVRAKEEKKGTHFLILFCVLDYDPFNKGCTLFSSLPSYLWQGLKASAVNPERFDPRPDSPALATAKSHSNNVSNQPSPQTAPRSISPVTKKETDSSCELHSEMSEVCMDMMSRYTFAPCMSQPNR